MLPDPRAWGRHLRAVCCVCLILLFAPVTQAGEQCRFPEFFSTVINEEMLERVLAHEPTCRKDVDWLFWVGQALNTLHRYPEAADRLESVLMLDPDNWQARVEYLVALEGSGEIPSARALQAELIHDAAIPESVRRALSKRLLPDLPLWREQARTTYSSLTFTLARDSNLLGSPSAGSMDLTFPDGRVPVILAPENRPRSGVLNRLDYRHQLQLPMENGERFWHAFFIGNLRYTPSLTRADYTAYEVRLENAAYEQGPYIQTHFLGALNRDGEFYRQTGLEGGWERSQLGEVCRLRLGGEYQHRQYPAAEQLEGHYAGLLLRNVCVSPGWKMELRLGQDMAVHEQRPGGDRQRIQLAFGRAFNWQEARLYLDAEFEHLRDLEGYSPLLETNLKRRINRQLYRVEFNKPMFGMEFIAGLELSKQDSNLVLFETESRSVYLGLRYLW